jgi:hypothetical protein
MITASVNRLYSKVRIYPEGSIDADDFILCFVQFAKRLDELYGVSNKERQDDCF